MAELTIESSNPRWYRIVRLLLMVAAGLGWLGLLAYKLHYLRGGGHQVDDSYMFYRYADHIRHGLGFSWNMDHVPTFGMTALLWAFVIVPFSILPFPAAVSLTLASWIFSGAAIYCTSAAIWNNSSSRALRDRGLVLALVTLSFLLVPAFDYGTSSGMETMLGFALIALLAGLVLEQGRRAVRPEWIGAVALLIGVSRPEGLLPAVLLICLARLLVPGVTTRAVLRALLVVGFGMALVMVLSRLYFGSFLPLSFYVKSRNGYLGFAAREYPFTAALTFLKTSSLYLFVIAFLATRRSWRMLLLLGVALAAVMAYLCTVTQIMGFHQRYYAPYLPLLAIPAFLLLDDYLARRKEPGGASLWPPALGNAIAVVLVLAFALGALPYRLQVLVESHTEPKVLAYWPVETNAAKPAPGLEYFDGLNAFVQDFAPKMPTGTSVASTEVGYLGFEAPSVNVIDLAGLNDAAIALHGFKPDDLLDRRKPDVIWMPHFDYTWQRGVLMTDPEFLKQYEFYAGAFNYGLAIRKDSPARGLLEARLAELWPRLYPGSTPQEALATKVWWPAGTQTVGVSPGKY